MSTDFDAAVFRQKSRLAKDEEAPSLEFAEVLGLDHGVLTGTLALVTPTVNGEHNALALESDGLLLLRQRVAFEVAALGAKVNKDRLRDLVRVCQRTESQDLEALAFTYKGTDLATALRYEDLPQALKDKNGKPMLALKERTIVHRLQAHLDVLREAKGGAKSAAQEYDVAGNLAAQGLDALPVSVRPTHAMVTKLVALQRDRARLLPFISLKTELWYNAMAWVKDNGSETESLELLRAVGEEMDGLAEGVSGQSLAHAAGLRCAVALEKRQIPSGVFLATVSQFLASAAVTGALGKGPG